MPKYRKRPVVIEAREITEWSIEDVARWCNGKHCGVKLPREEQFILIETLEGEMRGSMSDHIIEGVNGEYYPCKPDIFEQTYEPVDG